MQSLFKSVREPKTIELERTDDGRLRLVVGLKKLRQATLLEYFLDESEARELGQALTRQAAGT